MHNGQRISHLAQVVHLQLYTEFDVAHQDHFVTCTTQRPLLCMHSAVAWHKDMYK